VGFGGLRVLGLLFPLVAMAGCTTADDKPPVHLADAAVPSYAAPSGAPDLCATLAGTTHLAGLPVAVGTLTAQPQDVGAKLQLTGAVDELTTVLDQVHGRPDLRALGSSVRDLIGVLRDARDAPLTDAIRTKISTGLDDVGRRAQAVCGFPT
jgi:hypothetical protein